MATTPLHMGTGLCLDYYFDFCSLLQDLQLHLRTMVWQVQKGFQAWQNIIALYRLLSREKNQIFFICQFSSHTSALPLSDP